MIIEHLNPLSVIPDWVRIIGCSYFDQYFENELNYNEYMWLIESYGFIIWRVYFNIQESELMYFYIANNVRRCGYGRLLLRHSQAWLFNHEILNLFLEVKVSNHAACSLYNSEGWSYIGLRKKYYKDGEDAANYKYIYNT